MAQLWLYESINVVFGSNISQLWMWLTVITAGNFISATAFLPSSTCMYFTSCWMGHWLRKRYNWATYNVAFSALVSWPFSAGLGIPLALDQLLIRRKIYRFCLYCFEAFIIVNFIICAVDFYMHGELKIAWLNIITYNVFGDKGPDLYGTEPLSYYLINLSLNFGPIWLLGLVSLPITILVEFIIEKYTKGIKYFFTLRILIKLIISRLCSSLQFDHISYSFLCMVAYILHATSQRRAFSISGIPFFNSMHGSCHWLNSKILCSLCSKVCVIFIVFIF